MIFEINEFGLHNYTLVLILLLPIISTMVSISRHIIGMQSLSLYAPIVLAYAFIEMSINRAASVLDPWTGIKYGMLFYIIVLIAATGLYRLLKPFRINYYSKMSLIFSGIASVVLITYFAAAYLGDMSLVNINIFSIVMIAAIAERLVARYARTDFKSTLYLSIETLILGIIGLLMFSIPQLQELLLTRPWILIGVILINLWVGSFRGLRLSEYFRFRDILDQHYEEDK